MPRQAPSLFDLLDDFDVNLFAQDAEKVNIETDSLLVHLSLVASVSHGLGT